MNIVKSSLVTAFVLVGALGIIQSAYAGPSAGSYDANVTCGSFNNDQHAAQEYFDTNDSLANLDEDGDGIACNDVVLVYETPAVASTEAVVPESAVTVDALSNTGAGTTSPAANTMPAIIAMGLALAAGAAFAGASTIAARRK